MTVTKTAPRRKRDSVDTDLWNRPAFGLTLVGKAGPVAAGSRSTTWRHVSAREIDAAWGSADARRTVDLRFPDGKLFLAVEHEETLGYLVRAPRFGRHLVAPDGCTITSALPCIPAVRWERLFLAQVLPLAAVLRGLEVFHASAVAVGGRTVAFIGASGVGKTSTAAHLVARGGEFITDDVLALEPTSDAVLAHPGAGRLSIDAGELSRVPAEQRARLGPLLGTFEKRQFAPTPVEGPRELAVIYFLQRAPSARPAITEVDEPRRLLGAPFIPHVRSRARLLRHLDICAQLAQTARTFVIDVPPQCGAHDVAAMAHDHALRVAPPGAA